VLPVLIPCGHLLPVLTSIDPNHYKAVVILYTASFNRSEAFNCIPSAYFCMFGLIVNKGINSFSAYRYGVDEGNVHPTYFAWIEVWGGGGGG